jgi:hypothetical protein
MNDLDDTITNYIHIKELLQHHNKNNDKFLDCVITLLDHYIDVQDKAFKVAWQETVCKVYNEEYNDDGMRPWGHSDMEYLIANSKQDKPKKWVLPVEEVENGDTGEQEYFVTFPDDLLEQTGWVESDQLEWVDQGDGSFLLKKV